MIVKFFKGKHSTPNDGLEYLEGGTKTRKVAPELLRGNTDITREHLKEASRFSKAYTYGCLSFEEENIDAELKEHLMDSFEQTLMAGFDREQYDMIWVEHRDKDRLEMNFHIVNMELTSGKSMTPYVEKRDIYRIDSWKNLMNDKFGFTNPNDPDKKRTFTLGNNAPHRQEVMKQVDERIFQLAADGMVNSQAEIIDALNDIEGIEVTRSTKSSISFKADGLEKAIRLKGEMYEKSYQGIERLAEVQAKRNEQFRQEREHRIELSVQQLKERCEHIDAKRRKAYPNLNKQAAPTKLDAPDATVRSLAARRDGVGQIPDVTLRSNASEPVPTMREDSNTNQQQNQVLPTGNTATNKTPKTTIRPDANNKPKPQKAAEWFRKQQQRFTQAITAITQAITGRASQTERIGGGYDQLKQNCVELNNLLKDPSKINLTLKDDQAFNFDALSKQLGETPTPPKAAPEPEKPKPTAPKLK